MTQPQTIRRQTDGSIDFDFYRAEATALRRQAMRDARTVRTAGLAVAVQAAVVGLVLSLAVPAWLAARPQASDADIRAAKEQPMWPLRARDEQLRLRLLNAMGGSAVH